MQRIPCITLTPPGPWAGSLCLRAARGLSGVGLCGSQEWEVTAGSPEQRPPGLVMELYRGAQLCLPPPSFRNGPQAPPASCPGPDTHPVNWRPEPSRIDPASCSVRCPLFSTRPGAPSVSPKLRAIMGSPQILRMNLSMDSMTAQGSGLRGV